MTTPTPVVLCGGSGRRLWPVSRRDLPKQYAPILGGRTMLEATLERVEALGRRRPVCVANEAHCFLLADALGARGMEADILLEPVPRNTAPALAAVAAFLMERDADALMLSLPADHHIPDAQAFAATIRKGIPAAEAGWLVTFGVVPTRPSGEFGYIAPGNPLIDQLAGMRVDRFLEKPDVARAAKLIASGSLWNSGIFLVRVDVLAGALQRHAGDVYRAASDAIAARKQDGVFTRLGEAAFSACRSIAIDHAVLEKHDKVAVVAFDQVWSDLGSWDAVADRDSASAQTSEAGNVATSDARFSECRNVYVHGSDRLTVAVGLDDVLIVDTPDALLVSSRHSADALKAVVTALEKEDRAEIASHRAMRHPWGSFDRLWSGGTFEVRRVTVKPGAQTTVLCHPDRMTHWVVVSGTARVHRGDEDFCLEMSESTSIPAGTVHSLENPGVLPLEVIETSSGLSRNEETIPAFPLGRVLEIESMNKRS